MTTTSNLSGREAATRRRTVEAADLAYIAVFAALIAALSLMAAVPLGFGVPITLQTLGVALTGLCLGPWRGFAATSLYVLVGLAGLPVFAGGRAGLQVLAGPTGGYLISFTLAALLTGFLARLVVQRSSRKWWFGLLLAAVIVSRLVVIWPIGSLWLANATGMGAGKALVADMAFWFGDLLKGIVAALLAFAVHRAFPKLLVHR